MALSEIEKYIREYLDYLEVEKNRSPKTRENYERYLARLVREMELKTIASLTEDAVREFRVRLSHENLKKITQSYYAIAIRNFLKYLVKRGVKALPPERIELPKVSRRDIETLEYGELERLVAAPKTDTFRGLRDRAILETLFSTGLRLSELCALPRYVDLNRGEITVRGKGDKLRIVFLSENSKRAIREYLEKRVDTNEALFVSINKKGNAMDRITPRSVERLVSYYARAAGIPKKVHPHLLRHAFATDLLINGADIRSVQSLLGHANIATTQIYTHLTNKELREVHKAFHGRRRKE